MDGPLTWAGLWRRFAAARLLVPTGLVLLCSISVAAQRGGALASLKTAAVPQPADLGRYVRDQAALVTLGKALFWDAQAGSDGRTACATCHFHAGADHRLQNQLASPQDAAVGVRLNRVLSADDFPFHQFANPLDNRSEVTRDNRFVTGSAGLVSRRFVDVQPASPSDLGADDGGLGAFAIAGIKVRQVTSRNTPSVINAVFNVRNFWDGRARTVFTGATPFGDSDPRAHLLVVAGQQLIPERLRLDNSSLASQAAGPALNAVEMSYDGRTWAKLGKKLLALSPLARQQVAPDDGALGPLANTEGLGLLPRYRYDALIRTAFQPAYWQSPLVVDADLRVVPGATAPRSANEFTQMEANFALFWSLAIQAYKSTLVSADSRLDQFLGP